MLWTLHNRANEAMRADAVLRDDRAIDIYQALSDYDYDGAFGPAEPSHAIRSKTFDDALRGFFAEAPQGVVVNLGEGLETQRFRVDSPGSLWLSVDLPEAIAIRERFIEPDTRHLHLGLSATDRAWFERVPSKRPLFVTAQGLFMYLPEAEVRSLLIDLAARFPGAWIGFDTIPRWLSRKTMSAKGWRRTANYTTPPMPWGINRDEIAEQLRTWVPGVRSVRHEPWRFPRGLGRWLWGPLMRAPVLRSGTPTMTFAQLGAPEAN